MYNIREKQRILLITSESNYVNYVKYDEQEVLWNDAVENIKYFRIVHSSHYEFVCDRSFCRVERLVLFFVIFRSAIFCVC